MNGDGNGNGSLLVNVAKYGVGSLIGVYLVWQLGARIPRIEESLIRIEQSNADAENRYSEIVDLFGRQQTIMLYLLKEICVSNAKDESGRSRCNPRPDSDVWTAP